MVRNMVQSVLALFSLSLFAAVAAAQGAFNNITRINTSEVSESVRAFAMKANMLNPVYFRAPGNLVGIASTSNKGRIVFVDPSAQFIVMGSLYSTRSGEDFGQKAAIALIPDTYMGQIALSRNPSMPGMPATTSGASAEPSMAELLKLPALNLATDRFSGKLSSIHIFLDVGSNDLAKLVERSNPQVKIRVVPAKADTLSITQASMLYGASEKELSSLVSKLSFSAQDVRLKKGGALLELPAKFVAVRGDLALPFAYHLDPKNKTVRLLTEAELKEGLLSGRWQ